MEAYYLPTLIIGICIPVFLWFVFGKMGGWKKLKESFGKMFYKK